MSGVLVASAGIQLDVSVLDDGDQVTAALNLDHWDGRPDHRELADFATRCRGDIALVGHLAVHGGRRCTRPVLVDEAVLADIADLAELAPLRQPRALAGLNAVSRMLPHFGLRWYGFHGLSHAYASRWAGDLLGAGGLRVVTCHLGSRHPWPPSGTVPAWTPRWASRRWRAWPRRPGAAASTRGSSSGSSRRGGLNVAELGGAPEHTETAAAAQQEVDAAVAMLAGAGITAHGEVPHAIHGHAARAITDSAEEHNVDVIVMGSKGRSDLVGALSARIGRSDNVSGGRSWGQPSCRAAATAP